MHLYETRTEYVIYDYDGTFFLSMDKKTHEVTVNLNSRVSAIEFPERDAITWKRNQHNIGELNDII